MAALPVMRVGRETAGVLDAAQRREWLAVDGTGSYATGTVAGSRTRRYHGLLVAATAPPVGRILVCGGLAETVRSAAGERRLHTQRWVSGAVDPRGFELVEEMALEGTLPVWRYALDGGVVLERRIWMPVGSATTRIEYVAVEVPDGPLSLRVSPLMAWRDHHATMRAGTAPGVEASGRRLRVTWPWRAVATVDASTGDVEAGGEWYLGMHLDEEAARGLDAVEDLYRAGAVTASLGQGDSLVLTLGVEGLSRPAAHPDATVSVVAATAGAPSPGAADAASRAAELARQAALLDLGARDGDPPWVRRLVLAAGAFVVAREAGQTVVAGYPWFADWGRDTFIALPGLALETGRHDLSAALLRTFAGYVDMGMVPNRFPDGGEAPEYNTIDATLWFVEALRRHVEATGDEALVDELWQVLEEIVRWHVFGTRHGIGVDPADGLLRGGEPGVALTWMDARVGDWVVTPRIGKPVEVNALWYSALRTLEGWARTRASRHDHARLAGRVLMSFDRYWNPSTGCLVDVLDGPAGDDPAVRPNQLIALGLPHRAVTGDRAEAVLDVCLRLLRTSAGLRTLEPAAPGYVGHCAGGVADRDGAYHQGTVWAWLLGPLAAAHLSVRGDPEAVLRLLAPIELHLGDAGLGSVSEIADGDPPHTPRGCPWQAWSVAEVLRAWRLAAATARPERTSPSGPGSVA